MGILFINQTVQSIRDWCHNWFIGIQGRFLEKFVRFRHNIQI